MNAQDTLKDLQRYEQAWTDKMVDFWQERINQLGIYDTGRLRASLHGVFANSAIRHQFLEYGLYVAAGVGYGYKHGNGGDLPFMQEGYRHEHRLDSPRKRGPAWGGGYTSGKPRQRRDWFAAKYLYSLHRLNEKEAAFYGEAYQGILPDILDQLARMA